MEIRIGQHLSENFPSQNGLKQKEALRRSFSSVLQNTLGLIVCYCFQPECAPKELLIRSGKQFASSTNTGSRRLSNCTRQTNSFNLQTNVLGSCCQQATQRCINALRLSNGAILFSSTIQCIISLKYSQENCKDVLPKYCSVEHDTKYPDKQKES